MDPISIYSKKAADYAAYRPEYVPEAITAIIKRVGLNSNWNVADIGSGTGKLTKHFINHVRQIYAVEPDPAMREEAEKLSGGSAAFCSIDGRAEATGLPESSLDLIVAGQAIHWFDTESARKDSPAYSNSKDGWQRYGIAMARKMDRT